MSVCPKGAISPAGVLGEKGYEIIKVDEEKCIGCGACAEKCPKHVVKIREDKAKICDTCGGDPTCVKTCPQNALTFE